jgi:dihydroorotase/N-acyl-D-amino-acid deacylase
MVLTRAFRLAVIGAGLSVAFLSPAPAAEPARYDIVLRGGRIVDGTGAPWYRADVGIRGDTIVAIGRGLEGGAARVIDVGGHVVSPGFIDIHAHASPGIFRLPTADNCLRQGVTTLLDGIDGFSPVPLAPFLEKVEATRTSVNLASFIGQGSVCERVLGRANRRPTADELEAMQRLVQEGMRDGAVGMSTGLFYVPGSYATTEEVAALARVAGAAGGIHVSHMRDEARYVVESVRETIAIGEQGGLPTHISHHKIAGKNNWGRSRETLRLVDEARGRGIDVTLDQYPYTATQTMLGSALLSKEAQEGGPDAVRARLRDPQQRAEIKKEAVRLLQEERAGGDARNIVIARCEWQPSLAGKNLAEITEARGLAPTMENAAEVALWILEQGGARGVFHTLAEEDLQRILVHPATMIASDGGVSVFGEEMPHPRAYGTFVRVLAVYVREKGLLRLEEAIRKMTAMPAQRIGLMDRGLLRPGMKADLVVFDPERVADTATFENPHQYAVGVSHVVVNGEVAFENGAITAARPGRVLRGPGVPRP